MHGTRKTCGSLLAALDVHPRVAMQILRHSKIADHDGDLHRGTLGGYPRRAPEARTVARGHRDMSAVAALAAALGVREDRSQDRKWPLSWARSEGLEPPTF